MTRDAFKSKVYEAEFEVRFIAKHADGAVDFYGQTLPLPDQRKFGDLEAVQRYVDAVCGMTWVKSKYPMNGRRPPSVVKGSNETKAHYTMYKNQIAVPVHRGSQHSWAMTEIVVLHELAHYFAFPREDETGPHGRAFVKSFLDLAEHCMDPVWRLLLTRAFDTRGVPLA